MNTGEIFSYKNSGDVLKAIFASRLQRNPRYSIRAWATQLELKGHSQLYQVYKGDRKLKVDLAKKIIAPVKLSKVEKRYFELLVLEENASCISEKETYQQLRKAILPLSYKKEKNVTILGQEYFKVIADWYHVAILEMTNLKDFSSQPEHIYKMLGGKVSLDNIKEGIQRMIKLDLLIEVNGKLKRAPANTLLAEYETPVEAIRSHHCQMIDVAKNSMKLPMDKRDIRGTTYCIRHEDKDEIIALVKTFHQQMLKFAASNSTGELMVQFNTQFVQLTGDDK